MKNPLHQNNIILGGGGEGFFVNENLVKAFGV